MCEPVLPENFMPAGEVSSQVIFLVTSMACRDTGNRPRQNRFQNSNCSLAEIFRVDPSQKFVSPPEMSWLP